LGWTPITALEVLFQLADLVEVVALQFDGDRAQLGQAAQRGLVSQGQPVRAHSGVLVGDRGMVPFHIMTMSLPRVANERCWPERNPSPRPTSTSSEPTPQAMPNMVRKLAQLVGRDGAGRPGRGCLKMTASGFDEGRTLPRMNTRSQGIQFPAEDASNDRGTDGRPACVDNRSG